MQQAFWSDETLRSLKKYESIPKANPEGRGWQKRPLISFLVITCGFRYSSKGENQRNGALK